uniref:Uncharacterized protein n=1 Tax=Arion vulgaris TaxID=1028688 RepID=A0A0B7APD9_9EUPU
MRIYVTNSEYPRRCPYQLHDIVNIRTLNNVTLTAISNFSQSQVPIFSWVD